MTNKSRLTQFWPLLFFLAMMVLACLALWHYWPQLQKGSADWQRSINQTLSALIREVAVSPRQAGLTLLGFSFLYGVLHALGPGHGKVVITTWLATHRSNLKTSLKLTFAAALVQGGVAIGLVSIVLFILQLPARQLHLGQFYLEKASYLLVASLGLLLCLRAVRKLARLYLAKPVVYRLSGHAHHDAKCGCGHQHIVDQRQLPSDGNWRTHLMIVLSMGIRPCSGAVLILLFSKVVGVYTWGIASALAMACGTALTIACLALVVQTSRGFAQRLAQKSTPALWQQVGWLTLALMGGGLLVVAGGVMWFSALPLSAGGRPF